MEERVMESNGYIISYDLNSGLLEIIKFENDEKVKIDDISKYDFEKIIEMLFLMKYRGQLSDEEFKNFVDGLYTMMNSKGES